MKVRILKPTMISGVPVQPGDEVEMNVIDARANLFPTGKAEPVVDPAPEPKPQPAKAKVGASARTKTKTQRKEQTK